MAGCEAEDAIELAPLNPADPETGSDERRGERGAARTDPATAGAESEEGGGGGAGDGCWDKLRNPPGTISGVILNMLITGAIIFDWVSVWKYIHQTLRDPETDHDPLYWRLGLPCLLSPGLLLLALMTCYYITKKAEFTADNLFGACGLVALFPLYILTHSIYFILRAISGNLDKRHIRINIRYMPFTIVEIVQQAVLRLIFNPYDWSTVVNRTVNISLISALLISLSVMVLSSSKVSWKSWHGWMKRNAEIATNIEKQNSEGGSEEVNRECCSCMRNLEILVTVVLGLWPAGDIFSDCYSVWDYYDRYRLEPNSVNQAWFWQLGLTFMFIPGLISLMVWIYRYCRGGWRPSRIWWAVECAVITPLYPLYVITDSINTASRTLRGVKVNDIEEIKENTKEIKLFEIIGESLPQTVLSAVFISYNKGPKYNIANTISCVLSFGNILIGIFTCIFYRKCTTCDFATIPQVEF